MRIKEYFRKLLKSDVRPPAKISVKDALFSGVGALICIGLIAFITYGLGGGLLFASLGASAVLVFAAPQAPLSQPRNVLVGHVLAAAVGVLVFACIGLSWMSLALGIGCTVALMVLTKSVHPPAGATVLITILGGHGPLFILYPVAVSALIVIVTGWLYNNLSKNRTYPLYWF